MAKFSRGSGVGYQTVRRWAKGVTPPPPLACTVLTLLETLNNHGHPLPPEYA
jgi:DNA-binding transcriptional regulator YiaG